MWTDIAQVLPRPGPLWGRYPLRAPDDNAPPWRKPTVATLLSSPLAQARRVAKAAAFYALAWGKLNADERAAELGVVRRQLRRDGLVPGIMGRALGLVSASAAETLGQTPRDTQRLAAAVLLDHRLAEMATGEGKTLALGLAAAVAALAGMPVHVVTANVYLAARDAQSLAPLYGALGLGVMAVPADGDDGARRAAYAHDIVYATASQLAFDFLRDRLVFAHRREAERTAAELGAAMETPPLLRGLCMALLDEVDSIMLDEAEVPLILSHSVPQAARRAFLWQALALARQLDIGRDFTVDAHERSALLTSVGEDHVAALAASLGGPWQRPRYRREAVVVALVGLHACRRDTHYVVLDGVIELLDEVTGRIAPGRVWSRGLHTVVALKEGLSPPPETDTVAQITFQRFFRRYWRVAGLSGTLLEARGELHEVLGASMVRIPLHTPSRCQTLAPRVFKHAEARWAAVCKRVVLLQALGRPVLIGTDSVADSQALSQRLDAAGVAHRVLNALQDAQEANIISAAGRAGRVTVATRMAGRGTDIVLDAVARKAGGLHVLSCQNNPSHRLDRQLIGRAGRHGDPGSTEIWLLRDIFSLFPATSVDTHGPWQNIPLTALPRLALVGQRFAQWREELRRAARRSELLRQDAQWERRLSFAGPSA